MNKKSYSLYFCINSHVYTPNFLSVKTLQDFDQLMFTISYVDRKLIVQKV